MNTSESVAADSRSNWLTATATVGHLIVGLLALLGTCAGFLWGLAGRLATIETQVQTVIERNHEQDTATASLSTRLDSSERDRRILSERLTGVETTMSIEHRQINNRLDDIRNQRGNSTH